MGFLDRAPARPRSLLLVGGAALILGCGLTDSNGAAAEGELPPEVLTAPPGQLRWGAYSTLEDAMPRSFAVDLSDLRAPVHVPITEPNRIAEGGAFSPDGTRFAFGIVERRATAPGEVPDLGATPADVSLWLVEARQGFARRRLDEKREIPWARTLEWIDDATLLALEGSSSPNRYVGLDVTTGVVTWLGRAGASDYRDGRWLASGQVVLREPECQFSYWRPGSAPQVLPSTGSCRAGDARVAWSPNGAFFAVMEPGRVTLFDARGAVPQALKLHVPEALAANSRAVVEWSPDSRRFFAKYLEEKDASFVLGDVTTHSVVVGSAPGVVDYGKFASADVLLVDDREMSRTWVLRLAEQNTIAAAAPIEDTAWNWQFGDRDLSSDGRTLYYLAASAEHLPFRATLAPERGTLSEQLAVAVPAGAFVYWVSALANPDWLFYVTSRHEPGDFNQQFLLDLRSSTARNVFDLPGLEGLSYEALLRWPEQNAVLVQGYRNGVSHLFCVALSPSARPLSLFQYTSPTGASFSLPPRWPELP